MTDKLPIKIELPEGFLKEEHREGYLVSSEMKNVWAVELDLLVELLRVCKKYNIQIFAYAGTILGAVRHKGFIPWDDDIDMVMMREQYDKLCTVATKEFQFPYFFQTEYTDSGSLRGHAQLRNSLTTGILESEVDEKFSFNQGIFIDIFILDAAPDDDKELETIQNNTTKYLRKARRFDRLTNHYTVSKNFIKRPFKKITQLFLTSRIGEKLSALAGLNGYYERYELECRKCNSEKTKRVASYFPTDDELKKKLVYPREWYKNSIDFPFEFITIPLPFAYLQYLGKAYGNWKTPIRGNSIHGTVFFDVTKSYSQYLSEL